jgi:hypothetical protein
MKTHFVKVIESTDERRDFTIEITNNENKTISVNIPKDIFYWEKKEFPVGLNLVSLGHYE